MLKQRYRWVALALAGIAGSVDGIAFLLLFRIFTSHMSGNTITMTVAVAQGRWSEAWRYAEPILVFFLAVAAGIALADALTALKVRRLVGVLAGLELLLLAGFLIAARPPEQWMVTFPAAAMGIQNALLRRAGHYRVRTTFITGMITNAAESLVETAQAMIRHSSEGAAKAAELFFYAGIWLCFAGGGVAGAALDLYRGPVALLLPIAGLALLIALDGFTPLTSIAVQERRATG